MKFTHLHSFALNFLKVGPNPVLYSASPACSVSLSPSFPPHLEGFSRAFHTTNGGGPQGSSPLLRGNPQDASSGFPLPPSDQPPWGLPCFILNRSQPFPTLLVPLHPAPSSCSLTPQLQGAIPSPGHRYLAFLLRPHSQPHRPSSHACSLSDVPVSTRSSTRHTPAPIPCGLFCPHNPSASIFSPSCRHCPSSRMSP